MTRIRLLTAMFGLAAGALCAGCMLDGLAAPQPRVCDDCTPENMGGSGFALPRRGVVIYQGTVKIFDLDRRTFSLIETEPPLMRPHAATIVARRDLALAEADYAWAAKTVESAWAPIPTKTQRGCASTDGRLPATVVLVNQAAFFADYECGATDTAGLLSELTARADKIVQQRFADVTPK